MPKKLKKEYSKLVLKATNKLLRYFEALPSIPCGIPPISDLIEHLQVSRTTIHKMLEILGDKGITRQDGTNKILLRKPRPSDFFSVEEMDNTKSDLVEKQIIKKLSSYELKPGDRFSELELANELKTNTVITREALSKIAQSGIIKKHPRQKWEVVEFSSTMINEIASVRKLYEGFAIQAIQTIPGDDPLWEEFSTLEKRHLALLKQTRISAVELRDIERSFHTTIIQASNNRFIEKSYNSIFTLIFFHLGQIEYDKPKIEKVLQHHLTILQALLARDFTGALQAMAFHLDHAKMSMKNVNHVLELEKEKA